MAGITEAKIKEICKRNNITDKNLIQAITDIFAENNDDKGDGKPTFG